MRVLTKLFAVGVFSLASMGTAYADEPSGAEAAREVIQSQISAFEDKEIQTAYGFAAPNIQRIFPNPQVFGRMVREGYPMVWNPSETLFLDVERRGEALVQRLRIVDQAGVSYVAEYIMVRINGEWRIAGVQIEEETSYGV